MDYLENLQLIAMNSVENPTYADWLKKIRHWYAKNYNVSILDVLEHIEDEFIITTYYEHIFNEMEPEDRKAKIQELVESEQEKTERLSREKAIDDEILKEMEEEYKTLKNKQLKLTKPEKAPIKETKEEAPIVFEFEEKF